MFHPITYFFAPGALSEREYLKAESYILKNSQPSEQCIVLKNEADIFSPWRQVGGVLVFQNYLSGVSQLQACNNAQQGGFSASRRTQKSNQIS